MAPPLHGYTHTLAEGSVFTDGFETLIVEGDETIVIDAVRMVGDQGLVQLGAKIIGPDRRYGSVQMAPGWPPRDPDLASYPSVDAVGARLEPGHPAGYELLIGIRIAERGPVSRSGVEIDYSVGDERYTVTFPAEITMCTSTDQQVDGSCPDGAT